MRRLPWSYYRDVTLVESTLQTLHAGPRTVYMVSNLEGKVRPVMMTITRESAFLAERQNNV